MMRIIQSRSSPALRLSRVAITLLGVLALLGGAALPAAEITSIGDWRCESWTERRGASDRADAPQMWLAGYMTGLVSAYRVDALAITDSPTRRRDRAAQTRAPNRRPQQ
jgi:hypothetical protein